LIFLGQIEVRSEELDGLTVLAPLDGELARLILPRDVVEIEKSSELPLAFVDEFDEVGWAFEVE